ncbi:MAG: translocation/assembly module TamB domain-containing protein [Chlamydiota bacterium]
MKKKSFAPIILYLFSFLSLIAFSIGILLHTSWGQKKLLSSITYVIQKNGIVFLAEKIEVPRPWTFQLTNVKIQQGTDEIFVENLQATIRLLPLAWKELSFKNLQAQNITLHRQDSTKPIISSKAPLFTGKISIQSFSLKNLHINPTITLHATGKGKYHKKTLFLTTRVERENFSHTYVDLETKIHKNKCIFLKASGSFTTLLAFFPSLPFDGEGSFALEIKEPWEEYFVPGINTWDGKLNATFQKLSGPDIPKNLEPLCKDFLLSTRFSILKDLSIKIPLLSLSNTLFSILAQLEISPQMTLNKASFSYKIPSLFPILSTQGAFLGKGTLLPKQNTHELTLDFHLDNLQLAHIQNENFKGTIHSVLDKNTWAGTLSLNSVPILKKEPQLPIEIHTSFSYEKSLPLQLTNLSFSHPSTKIEGNLTLFPDLILEGMLKGFFTTPDLLQTLFPTLQFQGSAEVKALFSKENSTQNLSANITLKNFQKAPIYLKEGTIIIDSKDIYNKKFRGTLSIEGNEFQLYQLQWKTLTLKTSTLQDNFPFEIETKGDPLSLQIKGFWLQEKEKWQITVHELLGQWKAFSFTIENPFSLFASSIENFSLSELKLSAPNTYLNCAFSRKSNDLDLHIQSKNFPYHLFYSPIPPTLQTVLNLSLQKIGSKKTGDFSFTIENPNNMSKSNWEAHLDNDILESKGSISSPKEKIMETTLSLPIDIEFFPWNLSFPKNKPFTGKLSLHGTLEEFLAGIDTGSHKISGALQGDLSFSNTLLYPKVQGSLDFSSGTYENFYTSSFLSDIKAHISSQNDQLALTFSSTDGSSSKGVFQGVGSLILDGSKDFPFLLTSKLTHMTLVESDLITATAQGLLDISGNRHEATFEGKIDITKATISIPEKMPVSLPSLPVTYIGPPPQASIADIPKTYYPLHVKILVNAPDSISLQGRGLQSQWKGSFFIQGLLNEPILKGNLEMLKGSFDFAGRSFLLTEGSLQFVEKPKAFPLLSLQGKITQKGVTILTTLHGPLNSPELTLQSIPPLAPSSIISLLVFGQDLSDISGVQALQLIATAGTFSGGPNVMEILRKNLGVDKLSFISSPSTKIEDPDKIALQIGKYIVRGVMVTFSQGLEEGSSNVIVEADLTRGFVFQAETQQEEEQGKFTLKWNKNY